MRLLVALVFLANVLFACSYITSGEKGMSYYDFAQKLSSKVSGICVTKSTGTPRNIYNIIGEANVVMGMFQSDILKSAKEQYDYNKRLKSLELLFPIQKEKVHLVVLNSSRVTRLKHLTKREIAVGDKLSGSYVSFLFLSKRLDMEWTGINYDLKDGLKKLYNGEVEAVFVVSSEPVAELQRYAKAIRFIDITESVRDYKKTTISKDVYGTPNDINTLEVDTLLAINSTKVTSSNKEAITNMVNAYIEMKLEESRVKVGKNVVDEKAKKMVEGVTNFFKKTVQGEDIAGKKKQNKLEKVESICQTSLDSMALYGIKRSQIVVDACNTFKEKVKKEKFKDYEFY